MPRDVDLPERLEAVASATIAVARTQGAHAVTIRSVARELGGSTTLVTNYLPSRAALILNALDQGRDRWRAELDDVLASVDDADRLSAVVEWSLTSTNDMAEALRRESASFQAILRTAAAESGFADPAGTADVAYLLVRGAYIAATESPEYWNETQLRSVIQAALAARPRHEASRT